MGWLYQKIFRNSMLTTEAEASGINHCASTTTDIPHFNGKMF